jgi:hypothetical protein
VCNVKKKHDNKNNADFVLDMPVLGSALDLRAKKANIDNIVINLKSSLQVMFNTISH